MVGKAETYCVLVGMFVVSHLVHANASGFGVYALGSVLYQVGSAGTGIMDYILMSDLTSMRIRAIMGSLIHTPVLVGLCSMGSTAFSPFLPPSPPPSFVIGTHRLTSFFCGAALTAA